MGKLKRRGRGTAKQNSVPDGQEGGERRQEGGERKSSGSLSAVKILILFLILAGLNLAGVYYWQLQNWRPYQVSGDGVQVRVLPSPRTRFARNVAKKGVPMVLKNSVVELWKARTRWRPAYLQSKLKRISGVYENSNRWFGPYYDTTKPLTNLSVRVNPYRTDVTMTGKQFFQKLQEPVEGTHLYFTGNIEQLGNWAERDVQPLEEFLVLNPSRTSVNVWMGQPHVIAHCHYDGYHNFYAQLYGTKKFTLFRPTNWPGLYPYPFLHPSHAQAQVNLSNPDALRDFPLAAKTEAVEVVLEPGDLLYMPPLWFHHVESMELSISVNAWTDSTQTVVMESVFALPLPSSAIDWPPGDGVKAVATAVMIYSMLEHVCLQQTCTSTSTDKFLEHSNQRITDKQLYFVHQLWSTRYQPLMEKGQLPRTNIDDAGEKATILCGDQTDKDRQQIKAVLTTAGLDGFSERVGVLVKDLPVDTWELWVGNYVEYVTASAVDVKYVGVFLMEMATCMEFV